MLFSSIPEKPVSEEGHLWASYGVWGEKWGANVLGCATNQALFPSLSHHLGGSLSVTHNLGCFW